MGPRAVGSGQATCPPRVGQVGAAAPRQGPSRRVLLSFCGSWGVMGAWVPTWCSVI